MAATQALLAASVVAGALGAQQQQGGLDHAAFHSFMQRYGRGYEHGSDEYHQRLALFSRRAAEAEAHNAAQPRRLWTAGVNRLSDRTEAELSQLRGWRGAAARGARGGSAQRFSGGTFLSQRGRGRALPREVMNWTSLTSAKHILDQGGCGSCWAVSSTAVLQLHNEIYNPQSARTFSPQELVSCVPNPHKCGGTGGCEGATVELALHWAMRHGLAEEKETPYRAADGKCKKQGAGLLQLQQGDKELSVEDLTTPGVHQAPEGALGLAFGMHAWERLPENGYEPLLRAVYERGPVGISVAARSWSSYAGGIFDGCPKDAVIDHAVVLKGYGRDQKLGKLFYLVQNSWGPDWGEHGHIRILRREGDAEECGVDRQPEVGTACEGGPKEVKVCGMCGILYDSSVPHFKKL